jgi:uncharacterized iron-regulated protein
MGARPPAARRAALAALGAVAGACALGGCAAPPRPSRPGSGDWRGRLGGGTVALLGEVHDNAALQRLRLAGLRQAVEAGWRPALAMEQFDVDRQTDIDRARRERPSDAGHLIAQAADPGGWDWDLYRPLVELALAHHLPLRAANLSRGQARLLVRADWPAVFDAESRRRLGLDGPLPSRLQPAQQQAVDAGHCGALPAGLLPGMARAQLARDAVMAQVLREQVLADPGRGVVLIAGNGHVRRDRGVPPWLLPGLPTGLLWVVGFVEAGEDPEPALYDAWVQAPAVDRPDPCAGLAAGATQPPAPASDPPK